MSKESIKEANDYLSPYIDLSKLTGAYSTMVTVARHAISIAGEPYNATKMYNEYKMLHNFEACQALVELSLLGVIELDLK